MAITSLRRKFKKWSNVCKQVYDLYDRGTNPSLVRMSMRLAIGTPIDSILFSSLNTNFHDLSRTILFWVNTENLSDRSHSFLGQHENSAWKQLKPRLFSKNYFSLNEPYTAPGQLLFLSEFLKNDFLSSFRSQKNKKTKKSHTTPTTSRSDHCPSFTANIVNQFCVRFW